MNDQIAMEMMYVIKKHGLKIPEHIAVFGFNNEPIGKFVKASLSTVDHPAHEIGAANEDHRNCFSAAPTSSTGS